MKELCTGPHMPYPQAPPTDPTHQPFPLSLPLTFGYHAMQVNDIVIVKLSHDSSFGEEVITSLLRGAVLRSEGQSDGMHAHAGAHPGMIRGAVTFRVLTATLIGLDDFGLYQFPTNTSPNSPVGSRKGREGRKGEGRGGREGRGGEGRGGEGGREGEAAEWCTYISTYSL